MERASVFPNLCVCLSLSLCVRMCMCVRWHIRTTTLVPCQSAYMFDFPHLRIFFDFSVLWWKFVNFCISQTHLHNRNNANSTTIRWVNYVSAIVHVAQCLDPCKWCVDRAGIIFVFFCFCWLLYIVSFTNETCFFVSHLVHFFFRLIFVFLQFLSTHEWSSLWQTNPHSPVRYLPYRFASFRISVYGADDLC